MNLRRSDWVLQKFEAVAYLRKELGRLDEFGEVS